MMKDASVLRACLFLFLLLQYVTGGLCINEAYIRLENTRYFALSIAKTRELMPSPSYTTSLQLCEENGGTPPSITSRATSQFVNQAYLQDYVPNQPHSFYSGANGDTTVTASQCDNEPPNDPPSTSVCSFRFRFGFFDKFSFAGEPGAAFWRTYYRGDNEDGKRAMNFYEVMFGDAALDNKVVPYGRKKLVGYTKREIPSFLFDIGETPQDTDVMGTTNFFIACEVQSVVAGFLTTSQMPQPVIRKGWKDLTWAQSHWYVIFIIIAVVILLIIIGIIVYCACTANDKPRGPPVNKMVMHEQTGNVNGDRMSQGRRDVPTNQLVGGNPFNVPMQPMMYVNPEDTVQSMPMIYCAQGNDYVYSQGNSIASDGDNEQNL